MIRRTLATTLAVAALAGCGGQIEAATAGALPPELLPVVSGQVPCDDGELVQLRQHRYDFDGDGVQDALVAVRCDTGAGAPPSAVLAVAATPDGPQVVDELLPFDAREVVSKVGSAGPTAVVTAFGYSEDAPRCCPDLQVERRYPWAGTTFGDGTRTETPLPEAG